MRLGLLAPPKMSVLKKLLATLCLFIVAVHGKKNVLFFAVDDLRPELGAYGHKQVLSPSIDSLASKSLVFERAYCQIAFCSPSRASLLTSRRPDTNHVWQISGDEYWRTQTNATTIPQYFKENGYISIGMGKVFHPGAPSGQDDKAYSWSPEGLPYYHSPLERRYGPGVNMTSSVWSFDGFADNELPDGQISDRAVDVLKQLKENQTNGDTRPFFLAVGFHKPHLPFYAPSKYFDMYKNADIKLPPNPDPPKGMPPIAFSTWNYIRGYDDIKGFFPDVQSCYNDAEKSLHSKDCRMSDNKVLGLRRGYYAAVSYTDAQIGKVMAELESQGLNDDTIIVLWGDHGWQLGEHNEWGKFTNFEDALRVPFMIHVPGTTNQGMRTNAIVELIDIFPTLVDLTGLKKVPVCPKSNHNLTACVEGNSIADLITDPQQEWEKAAFSQYARPLSGLQSIPNKPAFPTDEHQESVMGYSIRVDRYRFTEWYRFDRTKAKPNFDEVWGTELYNHTEPVFFFNDENVNRYDDPHMKSIVEELRERLQGHFARNMGID